ncbi:hypothetical protein [Segetibacter sp.]|jgi:hypothetical protein|uniref:hypothetical protein n=1 Tax=Segetibacter sp. TaxID=2231182 RepID=UPI0026192E2D|nr:hypothetical protein [Segetibacter sp.]MCW3080657.1 hypothetical protein [Segetibacter sp.]
MTHFYSYPKSSIEAQIHEEEVQYNEAFRMKAEFAVLKAIQQKIKRLKAELNKQKPEVSCNGSFSTAN